MERVNITQDMNEAISVLHSVGEWMLETGMHPNEWWVPEHMNSEFLLHYVEPEEFYVLEVDGTPVACVVLQETERNQSWKYVDGDVSKQSLYIHWLAVKREFAGVGLSARMVAFAEEEAKKRGFTRLRLDTNADEPKLVTLYKGLGFVLRDVEDSEGHRTAYFEKVLE